MSILLLRTKHFVPAEPAHNVPRTALLQRLDEHIARSLTIVSAPAGSGKTTLIGSWVRRPAHASVWVSLDESDNDPALFWAYVVHGFQAALAGGAGPDLTGMDPGNLPPVRTLLAVLINALTERTEKIALVLDDYHAITNPRIHRQLTYLIEHRPPALHVILLTRADPPLPLARWRGSGLVNEIRSGDLRFTVEEMRVFLNEILHAGLSDADLADLERRTEGWIIGIQLAALSIQDRVDKSGFIAAFSGSHHYILEYLTEEVLDRLPEDVRTFLLQTSVLDQFNARLCARVTGMEDAAEHLAALQRQNLFLIPLDDERMWFRYHHLFRDLLQIHLKKKLAVTQIRELLRRASDWYRGEFRLEEAVKYALAARDFEHAAEWIEHLVDSVVSSGRIKTLIQWIGALPAEVILVRPRLLLQQGWVVFLTGKTARAAQLLHQSRNALSGVPAGDERNHLQGQLSAMQATVTSLTRDLEGAVSRAEEALSLLPPDDDISRARALRARGVCRTYQGKIPEALADLEQAETAARRANNLFLAAEIYSQIATVRKHRGELSLAERACREILDLFPHPEAAPPACLGHIGLAEIALERDQLADAESHLALGINLCLEGEIGYALQPAYLIRGLLKQTRGDPRGAMSDLREAEKLSHKGGGSLESILGLAYFQTRFFLLQGEPDTARQWAEGKILPGGGSFEDLPLTLDELRLGLLARVALAAGEFARALDICTAVLPAAESGGRNGRVIEFGFFRALALRNLGRLAESREALERCLAAAEPEGYVRLFREQGDRMDALLRDAAERGKHSAYVSGILSRPLPAKSPALLTDREIEILRLMSRGCSNQTIADSLTVSVNTVKKHTSNIYGKLGVRNRAQAVLRARDLGMAPQESNPTRDPE